jgi:pimeloyl-ACP methyl ester carboxylesterase
MLEMLNPSPMDVIRFAAQTYTFRRAVLRTHKENPSQAYKMVADQFCTPPAAAKRTPDLARLRADGKRFFGWSTSDWLQFEPRLSALTKSAETFTIRFRDADVQCYRWNKASDKKSTKTEQKQKRPRMLLCHGWEGYALNFAAIISDAIDADWEVIAFDHLAHGNSGGSLSGLPIALTTLLEVSAHVGEVDVVVGHSLGAAAALWAVANQKIKAQRLVLLAPFYDTFQLTRMWSKAHVLPDEICTGFQQELERVSGMTIAEFLPAAVAPMLVVPTLIIHDPKDPITAFKHSRNMAKLSAQITLVPAEKLGHVRVLADVGCVAQVMAFVATS